MWSHCNISPTTGLDNVLLPIWLSLTPRECCVSNYKKYVQYIPRTTHMVHAFLCFVVVWHWSYSIISSRIVLLGPSYDCVSNVNLSLISALNVAKLGICVLFGICVLASWRLLVCIFQMGCRINVSCADVSCCSSPAGAESLWMLACFKPKHETFLVYSNHDKLWLSRCQWSNSEGAEGMTPTWRRHQLETFSMLQARWISLTRASDVELWCFLWSAPEQMVEQTLEVPVIWDIIALIMMSLWLRMII